MNFKNLNKNCFAAIIVGALTIMGINFVNINSNANVVYAQEYTSLRGNIIETAYLLVGTPFKMGGNTPEEGFDGSGYVKYVFEKSGVALPRMVDEQYEVGTSISKENLLPGDIVFYSTDGPGAAFCGIYSGEGKFIYAGTKSGVIEGEAFGPYWNERFYGAKRILD